MAGFHEAEAVHHGHHQVEDDRGRPSRAHGVERFATVSGHIDDIAFNAERIGDQSTNGWIVVDHEHVRSLHVAISTAREYATRRRARLSSRGAQAATAFRL